MRRAIATVALFGALAAGSATPALAQTAEADAFAERVNQAIVACFYQVTEATTESRANQLFLSEQGLRFAAVAPPAVVELANVAEMGAARYTNWQIENGVAWIAAYTESPACRIMVGETVLAQPAMAGIDERLLQSDLWARDTDSPASREGTYIRVYDYATDDAPVDINLFITGPSSVANEGSGLQMLITMTASERS